MFQLLKTEGKARRGVFTCPHGTVQTPVFMNVGTCGAIKGAVSAHDLKEIGCQIELSNTYHLHLRPGDDVVRQMGGLHKFMDWDGPMLTDSGGFQVFSLSGLRKITEEGVTFASHIDGKRIFMGPEESMRIQSNLGSDIAELLGGKKNLSKGIHIAVEEESIRVDVSLLIKYGYTIIDVAKEVQNAVYSAIENTSGLTVECVNVHVLGVAFDRDGKKAQ